MQTMQQNREENGFQIIKSMINNTFLAYVTFNRKEIYIFTGKGREMGVSTLPRCVPPPLVVVADRLFSVDGPPPLLPVNTHNSNHNQSTFSQRHDQHQTSQNDNK